METKTQTDSVWKVLRWMIGIILATLVVLAIVLSFVKQHSWAKTCHKCCQAEGWDAGEYIGVYPDFSCKCRSVVFEVVAYPGKVE